MAQLYNAEEHENMRDVAAKLREAAHVAKRAGLFVNAVELRLAAIDLEDSADGMNECSVAVQTYEPIEREVAR